MDIMFLLDGSSNIGASEFEEMKNFVWAFIESVVVGMYLPFSSNKEIFFCSFACRGQTSFSMEAFQFLILNYSFQSLKTVPTQGLFPGLMLSGILCFPSSI